MARYRDNDYPENANGILLDDTSIVKSHELLYLNKRPDFMNVFALSNIIEGLVLHNKMYACSGDNAVRTHEMGGRFDKAIRRVGKGKISPIQVHKYAYMDMYEQLDNYFQIKPTHVNRYYKSNRDYIVKSFKKDTVEHGHYILFGDTYRERKRRLTEVIKSEKDTENGFIDILVDLNALKQDFDWGPEEKQYHDVHIDNDTWSICEDAWAKLFFSAAWLNNIATLDAFYFHLIGRAVFYYYLMLDSGIPYKPDFYRAPMIKAYGQRANNQIISLADNAMTLVGKERLLKEGINTQEMIGFDNVKTKFPFLLNIILSECNNPSEILDKTLEYRKSASATKFRRWAVKANNETEKARGLPKATDVLTSLHDDLSTDKKFNVDFEAFQVSALPLSFTLGRLSVKSKSLINICKYASQRRRLSFIYNIPDQVKFVYELNDNLIRIFGQGLSKRDGERIFALYKRLYS
ncbi:MAG: hypothetical protein KKH41_04610 [Candidatus Thermoplasmatota archaeon]|nr:hypothetical protein [Euryarchaeota archaeon]MBU4144035.1 hypothetical protein [Candidatus Thermoplasmatota archaeon]MBU4591851.1 hypothetical protein [Candidatus Thermoplasmatota archaeon]